MNTPAEPPAWYAASIARLAAIPPNDYPDASYLPLKRAIAALRRRRRAPGRRRAPAATRCWRCARSSRSGAATSRSSRSRPTSSTPSPAATPAPRCARSSRADGLALAREELEREAADVRLVWLCSPNNPTGEELDAALVERICAACPGIVVLDQAYLELGGEDFSPLIARQREPRRHAHVLEGLRARRRARRLRPGPAAAGRGARRAAPARLDLVVVGRRGRARLPRGRGDAGALRGHRRDERGRLAAGMRTRGRRRARAGRQLRPRALAGARHVRAARRPALRRAHVRRTSRCSPTASA